MVYNKVSSILFYIDIKKIFENSPVSFLPKSASRKLMIYLLHLIRAESILGTKVINTKPLNS